VEREAPKRPLPPFFLPVGGWDHLKDDHARLAAALKRHGADVEAPVYEKELHAFHAFVLSKRAQKCWDDHFRFMHARGTPVDLEPKQKVGWGIR
jgi:acetyl esterase